MQELLPALKFPTLPVIPWTAREAYEFLTERAADLSQAGFGMLLPGWWTRKGTKAYLKAQAKVQSKQQQPGSGLTLDKIIDFDWEIALGDRALTS